MSPSKLDEKLDAENQIKNSQRVYNQEKNILMSGIKSIMEIYLKFLWFYCWLEIIEFMGWMARELWRINKEWWFSLLHWALPNHEVQWPNVTDRIFKKKTNGWNWEIRR